MKTEKKMNPFIRLRALTCISALLAVLAVLSVAHGANLLFNSGFEEGTSPYNTVIGQMYRLTGTDNSVAAPNDWSSDIACRIDYNCGTDAGRWAMITDDPTDPGNRIMQFCLKDVTSDDGTPRVQSYVQGGTCFFQRVRMYLHPDMLKLIGSGLSADEFFMFQELWIRPNWTGVPNSFKISFRFKRDTVGGTEKFFWFINCVESDAGEDRVTFWEAQNTTVPVPIGEWFTAETYYKTGDGDNGRIVLRIQRDGYDRETVADVTDWTYHPDESPQGVFNWAAHKLYVRPSNVDYVRENGGLLRIYWDDWEVWDDMPEDGPDTTPPTIVSVATTSATSVTVNFSEKVDPSTAGDTDNYSINNGITVSAADLASNEASVTLTTSPLTKDATYTLTVSGVDDQAATPNTIVTVQKTICWDYCLGSSGSWQNFDMDEQTGTFEATYDATPLTATCDGLVTFSAGDAADYADCAILVRFNNQGKIDVRNGDAYEAAQDISYATDTKYHFRVTADVSAHTYSVYVIPDGGSETVLATDYAFRSEQSGVTSLDTWSIIGETGSFRVCGMEVNQVTTGFRFQPGDDIRNVRIGLPATERMISISGKTSVGGSGVYIVEKVNGETREYRKTLVIK